jgi:uncharacterized cupin superfamily protein
MVSLLGWMAGPGGSYDAAAYWRWIIAAPRLADRSEACCYSILSSQVLAMPTLRLPALDVATVEERPGSGYPEPFRSRMGDRVKRRLGDACGLTRFGVNLVTLGPGGQSALRHWHTLEDEFVYVLEGTVVLVTDAGEQELRAGDCAGYAAGTGDGHHLINRSAAPARYLEIGNRDDADVAYYPDDDLAFAADGSYAHKDGRPY